MKIIDGAIRKPVTTAVGAILLVMFGALALARIPVQLTPTVEEPQVSVMTLWPGASPLEIEREIVDEQEEQLKSLEGLVEMTSSSSDSVGQISLKFVTGTDLDTALLKVSNRLEQVPRYPDTAEKPIISSVDPSANAMAWFILINDPEAQSEESLDVATLLTFTEDFVKPEFERVEGVGSMMVFAGREQEMHVVVDPAKLALRRITITEFVAAIDRENRNISGGDFDEGKRRYLVRTVGEYGSPEEIEDVVVAVRDGVPVYVRDVAEARLGYSKPFAEGFSFDKKMIAMAAIRETGANVLETMTGLKATLERVNRDLLAPRGLLLKQDWD